MALLLLAYLGGVLTILSPCILPVLPFVFAHANRPFVRNGLPLLLGMAGGFAAVATLAALAGAWAVRANEIGRDLALLLMGLFGLALLLPAVADRLARPVVALGGHLAGSAGRGGNGPVTLAGRLLLGVATGLLWTPCAGPILGLILTGAALNGANTDTTLLLFAFGLGTATSLGLALFCGGRVLAALKRITGHSAWFRRAAGALVLVAVAAIGLGADTTLLARAASSGATTLEERLIGSVGSEGQSRGAASRPDATDRILDGAVSWLNAPPQGPQALRGKVIMVNFWTYSCINCLRALPHVRAWAERYGPDGLVVVGAHSPEFAFEKDIDNVRRAAGALDIDYPVAIDNDFAIWRAFGNRAWPAFYFIDATGQVRFSQFGEGDYDDAERIIRKLLAEAGTPASDAKETRPHAPGAQAAADWDDLGSPESYLGYEKASRYAWPGSLVRGRGHEYEAGGSLSLNTWALDGQWTVGPDQAIADAAAARILYRFHARDLHLVAGGPERTPVRIRVLLDGLPPGQNHGADIDADGYGRIAEPRLYQLIRQQGPIKDRTVEIEFLDQGASAYAFTFG